MTVKIFIGNVNLDTKPDQLREIFAKYGTVVEADVLRNYGFVHMEDEETAKVAIEELQGYSLNGNRIRVELSTGKSKPGGGGRERKPGGGPMRGRFGDRRGGGGGPDRRPYPPPPRPSPYDDYYRAPPYPYDYYSRRPYPPPPHPDDRLPHPDDRARYPDDRARLPPPPPGERYPPPRDRYPDPHDRYPPPHDRYPPPERYPEDDRYPPPRDRYPEDRAAYDRSRLAPPGDPYYRERAPATRPPPEYYNRDRYLEDYYAAARTPAPSRLETSAPGRTAAPAVANSYPNGYDYSYTGASQQGQGDYRDPQQTRNGSATNIATDYYSRFYNNAGQAASKFSNAAHPGAATGAGTMERQQQQQRPNASKAGGKYDQSFLQTGPIFF